MALATWLGAADRPRGRFVLALGAGLLAATGHAPFLLWPIGLAGLTLAAFLLGRAPGWWAAALVGWVAAIGYFGLSLSWLVEPFLVDVARDGWMAPFALSLMAGGLGLFWAAGFALARMLAPGPHAALALAVTLPLVELLRAYIFTGFPWSMVAYLWVDLPPAQWAAFVGPHGLNVLTLLFTGGVAVALAGHWRWAAGAAATAVGLFVIDPLRPAPPTTEGPRPVLRLVQPNAPQHLKWRPDMVMTFLDRQLEFTAQPGSPDLVIWPETAVPYMLNDADPVLEEMAAAARGTPVVFGIQRREDLRFFNSLAVIDAGGAVTATYDKHHLVPFGEYMPVAPLFANLGIEALASRARGGYAAGPGPEIVDLGIAGTALPLICYEAIFPQDVAAAPERPDWLLQITNDAWFGEISGPYQHLAQAQFRAIEQGLPVARAANTGISAVIDPRGRITGAIPLGKAGYLDLRLPLPDAPTPYARSGDGPLALLLLVIGTTLLLRRRRNAD